jgi:hypothetical protein
LRRGRIMASKSVIDLISIQDVFPTIVPIVQILWRYELPTIIHTQYRYSTYVYTYMTEDVLHVRRDSRYLLFHCQFFGSYGMYLAPGTRYAVGRRVCVAGHSLSTNQTIQLSLIHMIDMAASCTSLRACRRDRLVKKGIRNFVPSCRVRGSSSVPVDDAKQFDLVEIRITL